VHNYLDLFLGGHTQAADAADENLLLLADQKELKVLPVFSSKSKVITKYLSSERKNKIKSINLLMEF
jgi:hypothetical protein